MGAVLTRRRGGAEQCSTLIDVFRGQDAIPLRNTQVLLDPGKPKAVSPFRSVRNAHRQAALVEQVARILVRHVAVHGQDTMSFPEPIRMFGAAGQQRPDILDATTRLNDLIEALHEHLRRFVPDGLDQFKRRRDPIPFVVKRELVLEEGRGLPTRRRGQHHGKRAGVVNSQRELLIQTHVTSPCRTPSAGEL